MSKTTEITKAQSKETLIRRLKRNGVYGNVLKISVIEKAKKGKLGIYRVVFRKKK